MALSDSSELHHLKHLWFHTSLYNLCDNGWSVTDFAGVQKKTETEGRREEKKNHFPGPKSLLSLPTLKHSPSQTPCDLPPCKVCVSVYSAFHFT